MVVVLGLYPTARWQPPYRKSPQNKGVGVSFQSPAPNFWRFPRAICSAPLQRPAPLRVPSRHPDIVPRSASRRRAPRPFVRSFVRPVFKYPWNIVRETNFSPANDPQKSPVSRCILMQQMKGQSVFEDTKEGDIVPAHLPKKLNFRRFIDLL